MRNDRAVSETVSFVLVFSLVVAAVGVVSIAGFDQLEDRRGAERLQNAERAFDVLAANMEDITQRGAPSRATEIKLADAQLLYGESISVNVSVNETIPGRANSSLSVSAPIRYQSGSTSLSFVNGAVIRSERDGSRMLREPGTVISNESTVIQTTELAPSRESTASVGGNTVVLVRAKQTSRVVPLVRRMPVVVNLTLTTPRSEAWERYYEAVIEDAGNGARTDICQSVGTDSVSCHFVTDELYVVETRIEATLE